MLGSKDAPGTVKTQQTGLRWWVRFVRRADLHFFLFSQADLPLEHAKKERVEMVLLVFTAFLCIIVNNISYICDNTPTKSCGFSPDSNQEP